MTLILRATDADSTMRLVARMRGAVRIHSPNREMSLRLERHRFAS